MEEQLRPNSNQGFAQGLGMRSPLLHRGVSVGIAMATVLFGVSSTHAAGASRPSLADSFRIGSGAGVLCRAQARVTDLAIQDMFDRSYALACRDAADAIGQVHALRLDGPSNPLNRLNERRKAAVQCGQEQGSSRIPGLGDVQWRQCSLVSAPVGYRIYEWRQGKTLYVAEGLSGYDSVLQLGLRTVVADRFLPGELSIATTLAGDPAAFARVQAGTLDASQALNEGYRRNNSGNYVEASEFFEALMASGKTAGEQEKLRGEYLVNRALQRSNLGDYAEADALFSEAARIPTSNLIQLQLRRNFMVMHLLNQGRHDAALKLMDEPLRAILDDAATEASVNLRVASELNGDAMIMRGFAGAEDIRLTPGERSAILEGQALALKGTALRLAGKADEADALLSDALARMLAIREGRVSSIARMRAQAMAERALIAEDQQRPGDAEMLYRGAIDLLAKEYPSSQALGGARLKMAAFMMRTGQRDAARAIYDDVIGEAARTGGNLSMSAQQLLPLFQVNLSDGPVNGPVANDLFLAAETMVRPGVADTLSVLARELSAGDDDAARMFRQSVDLGRDVERTRIEIARMAASEKLSKDEELSLQELRALLVRLQGEQTSTIAALSAYPRYRAATSRALTLPDLQQNLKADEGYVRLANIAGRIFAWLVTPNSATAWQTSLTAEKLERQVDQLRETISTEENGRQVTYAFDVPLARQLYLELFGPVAPALQAVRSLIFEPDGAMLRLPVSLLIADQAGVDAYQARIKRPGADEFDLTGIAWLGRDRQISTAVAARAFVDVRKAAPSQSRMSYLGLGNNAPVSQSTWTSRTRGAGASDSNPVDCRWPLLNWDRPISAKELESARTSLGGNGTSVLTGSAFSDTALRDRSDLADFRILHFATHGLVTAPRPECPARPALLTSFGEGDSDGLLSFSEIYDLKLDADLVILSACDTAGKASISATREAGVTSGGGAALDGLVRAFIGAGGRSVIASHWPAPDDFQATERLISAVFGAPPGTSIASAMQRAALPLMDDPNTSHPFYWAGFTIIGDGSRALKPAVTAGGISPWLGKTSAR